MQHAPRGVTCAGKSPALAGKSPSGGIQPVLRDSESGANVKGSCLVCRAEPAATDDDRLSA
jgi:hypothetical protein